MKVKRTKVKAQRKNMVFSAPLFLRASALNLLSALCLRVFALCFEQFFCFFGRVDRIRADELAADIHGGFATAQRPQA